MLSTIISDHFRTKLVDELVSQPRMCFLFNCTCSNTNYYKLLSLRYLSHWSLDVDERKKSAQQLSSTQLYYHIFVCFFSLKVLLLDPAASFCLSALQKPRLKHFVFCIFQLRRCVSAISEFMGKTFQAAQHIVLQTRGQWKFSLADIKKIFCRSDLWSKISHVLVVQLETFFP